MEKSNTSDIAIIGYSGKFSEANTLDDFWRNLINQKECVKSCKTHKQLAGEQKDFATTYVPIYSAVNDADKFDANFFNIAQDEAILLDPQIRLLLECAYHALEHSGYAGNHPFSTGIFTGVGTNTYAQYLIDKLVLSHDNLTILSKNDKDFVANYLAYKLNCQGPALSINTACSTGLVVVHEACRHLLNYDCDLALAGAMKLWFPRDAGYYFQEGGIFSVDGHCRAFDKDANGTFPGNGGGIIVLKRLFDAIEDNDSIYAVIKGSAINHDGNKKNTFTSPSLAGQTEAILLSQAFANIPVESINYIETHGAGTVLGDAIEIQALTESFATQTQKTQFCFLGSVKTNIGHLDAAAGIAGLIKLLLMFKYRQIPPNLYFNSPNPHIRFSDTPFMVNSLLRDWEPVEAVRRAGISAFGIGGTNVHMILEEHHNPTSIENTFPAYLFVFSAQSETALKNVLENFIRFIENEKNSNLLNISYTLLAGRAQLSYRLAVVAKNTTELLNTLTENLHKKSYQKIDTSEPLKTSIEIKNISANLNVAPFNSIDEEEAFAKKLAEMGRLWSNGYLIDVSDFFQALKCKPARIELPLYPFDRQQFWPNRDSTTSHQTTEIKKVTSTTNQFFFQPTWEQTTTTISFIPPQTILFFSDESIFSNEFIYYLRGLGQHVVIIKKSENFEKNSAGFCIRADEQSDYALLFAEFEKFPTQIIHCWTLNSHILLPEHHLKYGFFSLLCLAKICGQMEIAHSRVTIITDHLCAINDHQPIIPEKATLLGPLRVISQEIQSLKCQLIDIGEHAPIESFFQRVFADCQSADELICYHDQQRFTQKILPYNVKNNSNPLIQDGGVYVIAGGLGGIGLQLASFLANQFSINLILLSRRQLPAKNTWETLLQEVDTTHEIKSLLRQLITLSKKTISLNIYSCDITNSTAVTKTFADIYQQFGHLDGIIHAAGLGTFNWIAQKSFQQIQDIFDVKIKGTQNLYHATRQHNDCFLLLCSSLSTFVGAPGLIDYVAANAYQDAFAQTHHNASSLNWDIWKDVGMMANESKRINASLERYHTPFMIHEFIESYQKKSAEEIYFYGKLDSTTSWVLYEHLIQGNPTLPGTAFIDILQACYQYTFNTATICINQLTFLQPLSLISHTHRQIEIQFIVKPQKIKFRILSYTDEDQTDRIEHAEGSLKTLEKFPTTELDLTLLLSKLEHISTAKYYQGFSPIFKLGNHWKTVQNIWANKEEALAQLKLPTDALNELQQFFLHPALLDVATEFCQHCFDNNIDAEEFYLPLSYQEIEILHPLSAEIFSHAKLISKSLTTLCVNIGIFDNKKQLLVRINGFTLKKAKPTIFNKFQEKKANHYSNSHLELLVEYGLNTDQIAMILPRIFSQKLPKQLIISTAHCSEKSELIRSAINTNSMENAPKNAGQKPRFEEIKQTIIKRISEMLGNTNISFQQNLLSSGMESLALMHFIQDMHQDFNLHFSTADIFRNPTLANIIQVAHKTFEKSAASPTVTLPKQEMKSTKNQNLVKAQELPENIVVLKEGDHQLPPLFCIHPAGGSASYFSELAKSLKIPQMVLGIEAINDNSSELSISSMAEDYRNLIQQIQPSEPYYFCGASMGGIIAYEIALQLTAIQKSVGLLAMLDTPLLQPSSVSSMNEVEILEFLASLSPTFSNWIRGFSTSGHKERFIQLWKLHNQLIPSYRPKPYSGEILYFRAKERDDFTPLHPEQAWMSLAEEGLTIIEVSGNHLNMGEHPHVAMLAKHLAKRLVNQLKL